MKKEVYWAIRRVAAREGWTNKGLACYLPTSEARVSELMSQRYEKLTLNQLFLYLINLYPRFRAMVAT